jgi:aspartate carbamoyltransferase regulatory subunit
MENNLEKIIYCSNCLGSRKKKLEFYWEDQEKFNGLYRCGYCGDIRLYYIYDKNSKYIKDKWKQVEKSKYI